MFSNMILKLKRIFKKYEPSELVLKVITLIRLLLGNYVNISDSRPVCYFMRLYCICFCLSVVTIYVNNFYEDKIFFMYILMVLEYMFTAIVHFIYGNKNLLHFFSVIKTNDRIMGFKKMSLISNYILFSNLSLRLLICILHALLDVDSILGYFSVTFSVISMDFNHFTTIIVFSILQRRMKKLRIFLESISVPINITGRDEVAISVNNIRKSLNNYNNLLDNLQHIDQQLQCLLFINWASHCISIVLLSYIIITRYFSMSLNLLVVSFMFELLQSIFLIFSPAVIVEATAYEVDKIKTILTLQFLRSSVESLRFELKTALQYVSWRPFRFTICRAMALNVNLVFTTIGLCITYAIVALQLLHFMN